MAAIIIEGFDKYQDGYGNGLVDHLGLGEWVSAGDPFQGFIPGAYQGLALALGPNDPVLQKTLPGNYGTLIWGNRFQINQFGTFGVTLTDFTTNQLTVGINSIGQIAVWRGSLGGTLLATSSASIGLNVWHYLEAKLTVHNTSGAWNIYLDGVNILSATGQNTRVSANSYANVFKVTSSGSSGTRAYIDDLYLFDNSGPFNNDVAGE
jgi:hypothetical protein